jgi:hypothetical protein
MEQSAGALADGRLAAGLDEYEQRPARDAGRDACCCFDPYEFPMYFDG